ncbi:MAG: hypothetical protein LRY55_14960 [Leadbetterella sp.]|nr:hypothetical protein [Leadbetterella sp.]
MVKNVLIGIGGTGSRVIESVVHLCAAGLGPEELHVFIIDPDEGNGSLERTKSIINNYKSLKKEYGTLSTNPSFKTKLVIPEDKYNWGILEDKGVTLSSYLSFKTLSAQESELADLTRLLFTEKELNQQLDEGFRGHPSIGAVVMAAPPEDKHPFQHLWNLVKNAEGENSVRVFLVGSVFGGTGAAGIPTLGAKGQIKYNPQADLGDGLSKVLLGAALVLPYFNFTIAEDQQLLAKSENFPLATKAALQYYADKDLGIDQYYLIGDTIKQSITNDNVKAGGRGQEKNPHHVELVSALAAVDFFKQEHNKGALQKQYLGSKRDSDWIDWDQLPYTRYKDNLDVETQNAKKALTDFTVFSYTYLTYGRIANKRKDSPGDYATILKSSWYKDAKFFEKPSGLFSWGKPQQGSIESDILNEGNNTIFNNADEYCQQFLFWLACISDNNHIGLVDRKKFYAGELKLPGHIKDRLVEPFANEGLNIGEIIDRKYANAKDKPTFNTFITSLNEVVGSSDELKKSTLPNAAGKLLNIFI